MSYRVAVVDDEQTVCRRLKEVLDKEDYATETFQAGEAFWTRMRTFPFQIVFLDLTLPDTDGLSLLERLKGRYPEAEVVIITGHGSIDTAIEAIKKGAFHYVSKPFKLEEIRVLAAGAREKLMLREENRRLRDACEGGDAFLSGFIGTSEAMQDIFGMIKKVAPVDCNVLLQGGERHRQGARGQVDPSFEPAPGLSLHLLQLRGVCRRADQQRAFRP